MSEEEITFYTDWKEYIITRIGIEYSCIDKNDFKIN